MRGRQQQACRAGTDGDVVSEKQTDADKIREIGKALGIDTSGTPQQIARRIRRWEARYTSTNQPPRIYRRAKGNETKKGRKAAKAKAKMQRQVERRFGKKKAQ